MEFQNYLEVGLELEDFNIFIPWKINKVELLDKIKDIQFNIMQNAISDYCGIAINSRFLNSTEKATITFNFFKELLKSVNISFPVYKNDLNKSFEYTQCFLEKKLGKPINKRLLSSATDLGNKKFKWKLKNVVVIHEIFESFSWRETLEIVVK